MDNVMTKEMKDVRINLKISPTKRREFQIVAELRGGTVSGLLHQFIVKAIHEEKMNHPDAFPKMIHVPVVDYKTNEADEADESKKHAA